jgi:hypothetical protein
VDGRSLWPPHDVVWTEAATDHDPPVASQLGEIKAIVRVSASRPLKICRSDKVNDGKQADNHPAEQ